MPQNDEIWPKIGIFVHLAPGIAGSFGALLVGWLVVVARAVSRKTTIYFMIVPAAAQKLIDKTQCRMGVAVLCEFHQQKGEKVQ